MKQLKGRGYMTLIFSLLAVFILLMSACSSSTTDKSNQSYNSTAQSSPTAGEGFYEDNNEDIITDSDSQETTEQTGNQAVERKIIKNANLYLQADDVLQAYQKILNYAKQNGGYETSYSFSQSQNNSNGFISAEIKIAPDKLDAFMTFAGDCAKVISSNITSDDITASYYDYQTRLETMEKSLDRYYTLLETADNTDSIIAIQSQIDSLTLEIESLKGQIKLYDSLVEQSTVQIEIRPTAGIGSGENVQWNSLSFDDITKLSSNGFMTVINGIWSVLQWILIVIISISPLLIIAAIVIVIIIIIVKRNKKKRSKQLINANNQDSNKIIENNPNEDNKPVDKK